MMSHYSHKDYFLCRDTSILWKGMWTQDEKSKISFWYWIRNDPKIGYKSVFDQPQRKASDVFCVKMKNILETAASTKTYCRFGVREVRRHLMAEFWENGSPKFWFVSKTYKTHISRTIQQ